MPLALLGLLLTHPSRPSDSACFGVYIGFSTFFLSAFDSPLDRTRRRPILLLGGRCSTMVVEGRGGGGRGLENQGNELSSLSTVVRNRNGPKTFCCEKESFERRFIGFASLFSVDDCSSRVRASERAPLFRISPRGKQPFKLFELVRAMHHVRSRGWTITQVEEL